MKFKKITAVMAALTLGSGLVACSDDSGTGAAGADADGVVSVYGGEPQNPLIPSNTYEALGGRVIDMIYSGLLTYDTDGNTQYEVAESIESNDDNTEFTVTLKDWEFADGTPVTSNSFVDAWNYSVKESHMTSFFMEPIVGYEPGSESMEGLEVVDDKTFKIKLSHPVSDFKERLGYTAFFPLPPEAFDDIEAFGEKPNGNGPYVLEEWNHNSNQLMLPNANYPGDRKPQNGGINYVHYASTDAAYVDVVAGQLDVLDGIPTASFSVFEDDLGSERTYSEPTAIIQAFNIPTGLEHFEGEEGALRRQAISMAFDREEITEAIYQGAATPAVDMSSPVLPGFNDSIEGNEVFEFNPDKAKELWEQANDINDWGNASFKIAINADGGNAAWADAVTNALRNNLEIDAETDAYPDYKSLRDDITNGTIDTAYRAGWQADYPSIGNFIEPQFSTGAESNDTDYSNPEFDELMKKAAEAPTAEEAAEIYNEAQKILFKDLPTIPMWYSHTVAGWSEFVDNVSFNWRGDVEYYKLTKN